MFFETLVLFYVSFAVYLVLSGHRSGRRAPVKSDQNILVVTAHPDDESMFFGPTIIDSVDRKHRVFVLCLSNGNFYGIGGQRVRELQECCQVLGVNDVHVIDDSALPDNSSVWWDQLVIKRYVKEFVQKHNINSIVTFDDYGISGHVNHRSIYTALRDLKEDMKDVSIYCLQSISIFRKYLSLFELPISIAINVMTKTADYDINIISFSDYYLLLCALHKHKSQMLWFRHLYYIFSRYMFINQLIPI